MKRFRKILALLLCAAMLTLVLTSCANSEPEKTSDSKHWLESYNQNNKKLQFSNKRWHYDDENRVWYQLGVVYCANPQSDNQTMGIYVPRKFLRGTLNSGSTDTYTCTPRRSARKAPIVCPVNTPGYSAQEAPMSYSYNRIAKFMKAGFIYLEAGMRGRETGAPWGVTDLKAAIRYYRFNKDSLPGNTDQIYTFGHSGGGAQSSLMGTSGDSPLYYPYLGSIGAAMKDKKGKYISDCIAGAMCWCPVTSLDYADESYEWNMGQFSNSGVRKEDTEGGKLSERLARQYPQYLNDLGLRDERDQKLELNRSIEGIYLSGSYYDYLLDVIETSLNNFLKDTQFPYTVKDNFMAGMSGPGAAGGVQQSRKSERVGKTYQSKGDYIKDLNSHGKWLRYDGFRREAEVLNLKGFIQNCKPATKELGAFDALDRSTPENELFGGHFDPVLGRLVKSTEYGPEFKTDLAGTDSLGRSVATRMNMYNPMFYLSRYYDGYRMSRVAPHWRINTGIEQGDTALCTEVNLALALQDMEGVQDVDFTTVWEKGHTMAERKGNPTDNFIQWVKDCSK